MQATYFGCVQLTLTYDFNSKFRVLVHNQSSCPYSPLLYKRLFSSFSFNNSQVFALIFAKLKGSAMVPPQQTYLLITNLSSCFKSNKLRFVPCSFTVKNYSLIYYATLKLFPENQYSIHPCGTNSQTIMYFTSYTYVPHYHIILNLHNRN